MKTLKDYIISCKGRTRVRVTMSVKHKVLIKVKLIYFFK